MSAVSISGEPCIAVRCMWCSTARMPPSSSPPPARPGPPWTRCGTGAPWPVEVRAVSRLEEQHAAVERARSAVMSVGRDVGVVGGDARDERSSAARDERRRLRRACDTPGRSRPGRTPRSRGRPGPRHPRSPPGSARGTRRRALARRCRRRARRRGRRSIRAAVARPPPRGRATLASTSSRCSRETSGPIVTASACGSPITTRSAILVADRLDQGVDRCRRARSPAGSPCTSAPPSSSARP